MDEPEPLTPEEERVLEEARAAWAAGKPQEAGRILDAYLREHPDRGEAMRAAAAGRGSPLVRDSPFPDVRCLRCGRDVPYSGRLFVREGKTTWGFWLGDVGELLMNREAFDTYRCPACGHVEFFTPDATLPPG